MNHTPFALIERSRIIAILRLDDLGGAGMLTRSLLKAGIRVLEFTLTNPQAIACVEKIKKEFPVFSTEAALLATNFSGKRNRAFGKRGRFFRRVSLFLAITRFDSRFIKLSRLGSRNGSPEINCAGRHTLGG